MCYSVDCDKIVKSPKNSSQKEGMLVFTILFIYFLLKINLFVCLFVWMFQIYFDFDFFFVFFRRPITFNEQKGLSFITIH